MPRNYGINQNTAYGQYKQQQDAQNRSDFWKKIVMPTVGMAAGGAALGSMGGGSAVVGGTVNGLPIAPYAGTAAMHSPGVAAAARAGWGAGTALKIGELAAGTFGNIYGSRVAQRSNREALAAQQRATDQAMEWERSIAARDDARYLDDKRIADDRYAAEQARLARIDAATESERLADRKLIDEREARRAPYRAASAAALERLPGIIASGRTSPGLGSLGSFRRG